MYFLGTKLKLNTHAAQQVITHRCVRYLRLCTIGMDAEQLVGTFGQRLTSGSDAFDRGTEFESEIFAADPSSEEKLFLASIADLSPSCTGYCKEFNIDTFDSLDADVVIGFGKSHQFRDATTEDVVGNLTARNVPIVFIDYSLQGQTCLPGEEGTCVGKSMIEIIRQFEELAVALGVTQPESLKEDKLAMCKAAVDFSAAAKTASVKGVRMLPAYINAGLNQTSYTANPSNDMVLRMFEELGAPILHNHKCSNCEGDFFWEYLPNAKYFKSCPEGETSAANCNESPLYPVDLWLYDHRISSDIISDNFETNFPDKAIQQNQYAPWAIGYEGLAVSYKTAANILKSVTAPLANAERIHPATDCTVIDVSSVSHKTVGLSPGEYACYNDDFYVTGYKDCASLESAGSAATKNAPQVAAVASLVTVFSLAFWM
jgi:hypothetical protein